MSNLLGAWSLSGKDVSDRLDPFEKARMLGHGTVAPSSLAEFDFGRLWLVSTKQNFAADNRSCLAFEGFIAFGGTEPENPADLLRRRPGAKQVGHKDRGLNFRYPAIVESVSFRH